MTPEQKSYHEQELERYREGGSRHESFVIRNTFGMGSHNLGPVDPPVVGMGQDDDPFYTQFFQNWEEVEAFIAELRQNATEAWGEKA